MIKPGRPLYTGLVEIFRILRVVNVRVYFIFSVVKYPWKNSFHFFCSRSFLYFALDFVECVKRCRPGTDCILVNMYDVGTYSNKPILAWIHFKSKTFSIMALAVWNSLSPVTISSTTIATFKAHLKTELFSAAYDTV